MTTFLLDVNVLIALLDSSHVQHGAATRWFSAEGSNSWASCPITENGVISLMDERIFAGSRLLHAAQLTDTYLLALAQAREGLLATFDRRLVTSAVTNGARYIHHIV